MTPKAEYFSPKEENEFVLKILDILNTEFLTEQVPIRIEDYSKPLNCFLNVEEKLKKDGGSVHYGWAILQNNIVCEAERHAVWESPDGELIDITPRDVKLDEIMFLSDNDFVYEGQLTDNVRINVTKNKVVDHFIRVCEVLETFYSYGNRITDDQVELDSRVAQIIHEYEGLKARMLRLIKDNGTERSLCICGGSKNYKNCHGKVILANVENDLERIKKVFNL